MNARQRKKQLRAQTTKQLSIKLAELESLNAQIENVEKEIKKAKKVLKKKSSTLHELQSYVNKVNKLTIKNKNWKESIDVSKEVGNKKYTEGQKNYIRALKVIESRLSKPAADIKAVYGSDDIEELANQYYIRELNDYTQEELDEIEKEFNKTHGYHVRLEKATNPFAGIDFNTLMPN